MFLIGLDTTATRACSISTACCATGPRACFGERTRRGRSLILAALTKAIVCERSKSDAVTTPERPSRLATASPGCTSHQRKAGLPRAVRSARESPPRAIAIAAPVLGRLVGEAAMVGAIGAGRRGRAAIAEFGRRRVAQRPAAHRFFQLDDRDPERHRQDDALELRLFKLRQRLWRERERGRPAHDSRDGGVEARPRDPMHWRGRQAPTPRNAP